MPPEAASPTGPKIELHVHLEGTVRPEMLLAMGRRNNEALPARTVEGIAELYRFRDFEHFIKVWVLTTHVMRTADDFREVVVDYAGRAAAQGAVYLEGIFSPWYRVHRGVPWQEIYLGYTDGAAQAREQFGIEVRLTPDIDRVLPPEAAMDVVTWSSRFVDRGIVGIGLGGPEVGHPPEPYERVFAAAADAGLPAVPHAGETAGAASVRGALRALGARRIRHGLRALEDPELVAELVERGVVLDVCPVSNLRTGAVADLAAHPLPAMIDAGLRCSLSTDDPAMFGTDLELEYAIAAGLGAPLRALYAAGLDGALCDDGTRARLAAVGEQADWQRAQAAAETAAPAATAAVTAGPGATAGAGVTAGRVTTERRPGDGVGVRTGTEG